MKQNKLNNGMIDLIADNGYQLVQKEKADVQDYTSVQGKAMVLPEQVESWVEVSVDIIEATNAKNDKEKLYAERIEELMRDRYTAGAEFAIINNRYLDMQNGTNDHAEETEIYMAYREECKTKAREEVYNSNTEEL